MTPTATNLQVHLEGGSYLFDLDPSTPALREDDQFTYTDLAGNAVTYKIEGRHCYMEEASSGLTPTVTWRPTVVKYTVSVVP